MTRERTVLLGRSRAGLSVAGALVASGHELAGIWNRSAFRPGETENRWSALVLDAPDPAALDPGLVVIAVSDDAIDAVASELAVRAGAWLARRRPLVLHLSGSRTRRALAAVSACGAPVASLHPLRSFPSAVPGGDALRGVHCGVEAEGQEAERTAALVRGAGGIPLRLDPDHKPEYHLAAAMASNFVVALLDAAGEALARAGITGEAARAALASLATGAVESARDRGPQDALTGPFVRGDAGVVARHLAVLAPGERALYRALGLRALALARRVHEDRADAFDRIAHLLEEDPC